MQYAIAYDQSLNLLTITVQGVVDLSSCQAALPDVVGELTAHQYPPVLVDSREAQPTLSATEVYQLAADISEAGFGSRSRFAIVTVDRADFDRAAFLEQIAANRGLEIQAFRDRETALRWVLA